MRITQRLAIAAAITGAAIANMPSASASPSGDLWNLANAQHTGAGCPAYADNPTLGNTALSIAKTMLNPPGGIAGNGRTPTDGMLANAGYVPTSLGEADYISANGSPQNAMNFWLANPTSGIFPNCGAHDMATAVWIQNGQFAAVLLAATPGGNPGTAEQPH
jgi:hypothetical protein